MPAVNPKILVWARETAGFGIDEAAGKLQLRDSKTSTAAEKLRQYEAGKAPSRALLVRMAKQYRRPLLAFYLPEPPRTQYRGEDYRTLHKDIDPSQDAVVDALVRSINSRQSILKVALQSEGEMEPLLFIGSCAIKDGPRKLAERISTATGFNLAKYRASTSQTEAFKYLRRCIESVGIFTILAGNLGSHHTNLDTSVFRGFALSDSIAPFVVINDQDARTAWSFTLLHEVAHLWLGVTGISGGALDRDVEKLCNDAASEMLLPDEELRRIAVVPSGASLERFVQIIDKIAAERKLSPRMVAFRLMRLGSVEEMTYLSLSDFFFQRWRESREQQRSLARETDGGPSYYVVKRFRLGGALVDAAKRMLISGELSTTQVGTVLGVRALKVGSLFASEQAA